MINLNSDFGIKNWIKHPGKKNQQNLRKFSISTEKELEISYPKSIGYSLFFCMYVYT